MLRHALNIVLILFLFVSCNTDQSDNTQERNIPNSLSIIINDMALPHEAALNGLPSDFDWSEAPRIGWGNNPPSDWFAMIPWGQVYRDTNPIITTNTRVQIRHLEAWYLDANDNWNEWTFTSDIFGRHFWENYADDFNIAAQIREEPTGGISIKFLDGYNFHFWPSQGRLNMDPNTIEGVWISVQARLILDDSSLPDDRDQANLLLGVGGDYWRNLTVAWDNFQSSGDIAIGRMKYLGKAWQSFNMHTLTPEKLNEVPPPFQQ